jgi:hypothetical protein
MKTMVCLVSEQVMQNVLPVLMYIPEKVYLLATEKTEYIALNLKIFFESKNIKTFLIKKIDAYDIIKISEAVQEILSVEDDTIMLNATGGTKIMALAAYSSFVGNGLPVIYCDTEHKCILHLSPEIKTELLKADLTIDDYLNAHGYRIKSEAEPDENHIEFFKDLLLNNMVAKFVAFTRNVRKAYSSNINTTVQDKSFYCQKTTSGFHLHTLFNGKKKYKFNDYKFFSGNWLESFVHFSLMNIPKIKLKLNVAIVSHNGVENEVDVIALHDYKLKLFSCKSGKSENEAIFEVETLRKLAGGTFGAGIAVVSDNKGSSASFNQRASEIGIIVINDLNRINRIFFK